MTLPLNGCRRGDDVIETNRWMHYELAYIRREAQAEADLAYQAWCRVPGRDGYAVYRAAQDRADAAQDDLAAWVLCNGAARKDRLIAGVIEGMDIKSAREESSWS